MQAAGHKDLLLVYYRLNNNIKSRLKLKCVMRSLVYAQQCINKYLIPALELQPHRELITKWGEKRVRLQVK